MFIDYSILKNTIIVKRIYQNKQIIFKQMFVNISKRKKGKDEQMKLTGLNSVK